jgi:hypothetical protein
MDTGTIPTTSDTANPYETGPFAYACDMEDPLSTVRDLLTGLMYLGQGIGDGGEAVARIAEIARDRCEELEKLRGDLFHESNPWRDEAGQAGAADMQEAEQ